MIDTYNEIIERNTIDAFEYYERLTDYIDEIHDDEIESMLDEINNSKGYKTIEKIYEENGGKKVNFIIGYDQFFKLESWKEPEILKEKINFMVIPRKFQNGQVMGNAAFKYFENKGYNFQVLNIDFLDVSSSMIRKYVENDYDIAGLTTKEVRQYIENNRLYKNVAGRKFIS